MDFFTKVFYIIDNWGKIGIIRAPRARNLLILFFLKINKATSPKLNRSYYRHRSIYCLSPVCAIFCSNLAFLGVKDLGNLSNVTFLGVNLFCLKLWWCKDNTFSMSGTLFIYKIIFWVDNSVLSPLTVFVAQTFFLQNNKTESVG